MNNIDTVSFFFPVASAAMEKAELVLMEVEHFHRKFVAYDQPSRQPGTANPW